MEAIETIEGATATERGPLTLTIRAAEPRDVDALTAMANLPGVRHGTLRTPFTPRTFVEKRIAGGPGTHTLVAEENGAVIGQGVLFQGSGRTAHAAEVVLWAHDDHSGRGVGTALMEAMIDLADNWLGLRRLALTVNADNARAIGLYERMGFEREGVLRGDVLRDGVLIDSYAMARLRDAPAHHPAAAP